MNEKPKTLHKRQKTHFNFQNLQNIVTDDNTNEQAGTSKINTHSDASSVKSLNTILNSDSIVKSI